MRKLALVLLLALPVAAADLTGRIVDPTGKPVPEAHVYVYTAVPKKGVSVVCPSCYRDCGKQVDADAKGNFRIKSVDDALKFRLLAVAEGFEPALSEHNEKRDYELTLKARPSGDDEHMVRGRVVDPQGKALVGALVEFHGVRQGQRKGWGAIPGIDPLSITNANGDFAIRVPDPDMLVDVRVRARNYGVRIARELLPGVPAQTVSVDVGATITGRLMNGNKPVPGARVGIAQVDHRSENWLGAEEIGTDAKGQFVMTGLATGIEYQVFPKMESVAPLTVAPRVVKTGEDRSTADAGTFQLARGFRVAGKVNGELPPETRVSLFTPNDTQSVMVKSDGTFVFEGVPAGKVRMYAAAPGFGRPQPIEVDVQKDVVDVTMDLRKR
ncbi:MAG TPA: carboxypeptidase regulatory-like domain-containing protein [Thermoanaerobaculia bacterium]|nr:carboxypeptidase regulatory-like domain-containing protein [Thermoanaerobaculia bacterium]